MDCGDESDGADDWDAPRTWCLRHAADTGHTLFNTMVISFLRASLREVL